MKDNNLQNKIIDATKWSTITEIAAKIVSPVTNMILARILVPEAFGVVATVTMITSFADMFTDAGFQKYLIQHEFKDEEDKHKYANVAFLTNIALSIFLWGIIALFSEDIADLVGNPGLGNVISIACVQLPLLSFSSIQMALYRRDFDFRTLFMVRLFTICIPFFLTIPLAFLGFGYWALIIGAICAQLSNAIILTIKSNWKPNRFYSVSILKEMFSFSIWSLLEAISIWLTTWVDTFIIGSFLNDYYLGIYKTSTTMVNSFLSLITAATVPVMFSALSRLQNDREYFKQTFFNMQRGVSILVFPLGVGVWVYSDIATKIILGSQWGEASNVIGNWAITSAIVIVFSNYCSEVYRAKGRPKLSFLGQVLHLIVVIPVCIVSAKTGFWAFVYARSWIRLEGILVDFVIMKVAFNFSILQILKNVQVPLIVSVMMGLFGYLLRQINDGVLWSFISIIFCVLFYFGILYLFPAVRKDMYSIAKKLIPDRVKKMKNH